LKAETKAITLKNLYARWYTMKHPRLNIDIDEIEAEFKEMRINNDDIIYDLEHEILCPKCRFNEFCKDYCIALKLSAVLLKRIRRFFEIRNRLSDMVGGSDV